MDEELFVEGQLALSNQVPEPRCYLVVGLELFGHEIGVPRFCHTPNGFELMVTIPDEDPETSTSWVLMAREL
ncbi:hypothetical protein [Haliangium ochraceum]|uniref:Uncharacterized protein n=1 Tax=Haliangium ochraceum (strain DSM 14365 / JCM 11303 / SMP-2) TaxID=502025 RepID=D0LM16_HALO1|nr:hypothetical protein [Haliangium ochraceum]ACY15194.1 hypothetical protein Hoch_2663 [Haliangium ochraceum DSM 14365]